MKRFVIFLLLFGLALLGKTKYAHAVSPDRTSVVAAENSGNSNFSLHHHLQELIFESPAGSGGDHTSFTSIDQENEDDLLWKHTYLVKTFIAFFYTFFVQNDDSGKAQAFPFYQHQAKANFPLYIRLRVFRI